jgi:hypothetical protein
MTSTTKEFNTPVYQKFDMYSMYLRVYTILLLDWKPQRRKARVLDLNFTMMKA